ncbi:MAG: hypothetical protein M3N19_00900 [Candidatus Eremiobacteraeota bacterium]|nr:hypothetical protein [Candidatus Eremiobacteraeota bacterium]
MDVAPQLQSALSNARSQLAWTASQTARAQTSLGGHTQDAAMASLAQTAIFSEALLSALHARLQEIKSVTK